MNTKQRNLITRLIYWGTLAATAAVAVCMTLAFFSDYTAAIGYFSSDSVFFRIAVAVCAAYVLVIVLAAGFCLKKESVRQTEESGIALRCAAGLAALAFLFLFVTVLLTMKPSVTGVRRVLLYLTALTALPSVGYFVTVLIGKCGTLRNVFSLVLPLCGAALLGATYFDYYTPINGPVKVPMQLALVVLMFAVLCEIRFLIGTDYARPRTAFVFSLGAVLLGIGFSVPILISCFAGILDFSVYTACAAVLFGFGVYQFVSVGTRSVLTDNSVDSDAPTEKGVSPDTFNE